MLRSTLVVLVLTAQLFLLTPTARTMEAGEGGTLFNRTQRLLQDAADTEDADATAETETEEAAEGEAEEAEAAEGEAAEGEEAEGEEEDAPVCPADLSLKNGPGLAEMLECHPDYCLKWQDL